MGYSPPILDRRRAFYPAFAVPNADDDEFDDNNFSGWTVVQDSSPLLTITEQNDVLSIAHPGGDAAAELHGIVKAKTWSVGDYVEACVQGLGAFQNFNIIGLTASDGLTYGAGVQMVYQYSPIESISCIRRFTNWSTNTATSGLFAAPTRFPGLMFMRLKYVSANNWAGFQSPDGISWVNVTGTIAGTLTPTHAGISVTTWGGANPFAWSVKYIRFGS
jgi:hypothetical protein